MTLDLLHFRNVAELSRLIASRAISPVDLVAVYLDRIALLDSQLHAYITVSDERARATARIAEQEIMRGGYRGPLHGIPVAVKDQVRTRGVRTTCGSRMLDGFVPDEDATVIDRLAAAGAIMLGKLNMPQFGLGFDTTEFPYGTPRNPWDLSRSPGLSSAGAGAATAAGLCALSFGQDTSGSILGPASFTGTVGLRPSWGRVSRRGVFGLCWSMDVVGPLARATEDCAIALSVIAGHDPGDPFTSRSGVPNYRNALDGNCKAVRIGIVDEPLYGEPDPAESEIRIAVSGAIDAISDRGATCVKVALPEARDAGLVQRLIALAEGVPLHRELFGDRLAELEAGIRIRFIVGSALPAQLYAKGLRLRAHIRGRVLELLSRCDILAMPTTLAPAPAITRLRRIANKHEATASLNGGRNYFALASLTGAPAISVPCGFTIGGLPIGLLLIGRPFEEATLLKVAHAYEQNSSWATRRPSLALGSVGPAA